MTRVRQRPRETRGRLVGRGIFRNRRSRPISEHVKTAWIKLGFYATAATNELFLAFRCRLMTSLVPATAYDKYCPCRLSFCQKVLSRALRDPLTKLSGLSEMLSDAAGRIKFFFGKCAKALPSILSDCITCKTCPSRRLPHAFRMELGESSASEFLPSLVVIWFPVFDAVVARQHMLLFHFSN